MGGVVITIDLPEAIRRFTQLGLENAGQTMDAYTQGGIFGDLERGTISAEEFRALLSNGVGRDVSMEDCRYAWMGCMKEVPKRNLLSLKALREKGYRLILLSNTNTFITDWVLSPIFDGDGHSIDYYFDSLYLSYRLKMLKPDDKMFKKVLQSEHINAEETLFIDDGIHNVAAAEKLGLRTFCPKNGEDWTIEIYDYLK